MDLKAQRDRFMAFSFASADLLLETDAHGVITFAMGASSLVGPHDAADLVGRAIGDLFTGADRSLLDHIVGCLTPGRRLGPVAVQARTGEANDESVGGLMVSGCALPGADDRRHFTIANGAPPAPAAARALRDPATGLVGAADYEAIVRDTLELAQRDERELNLTLLTFEGQRALDERLDDETQATLRGHLGALLRTASAGDAVSQVADGRYSLLHDATVDTEQLKDELAGATVRADPAGQGLIIIAHTLPVDPSMTAADAAHALAYAVETFASGRADALQPHDLPSTLDEVMRDTNTRILEVKRAIQDRQLTYVAQPVVWLENRRPCHYELLVRFEPGQSPFEVINFAERTGIVMELDIAVVQAALAFLRHGAPDEFPGLAVNVSGLSIVNSVFVGRLLTLLKSSGVPANKLLFEITESAEMPDLAAAGQNINRLRKIGHPVCLDDFGAGAASFPYLRALHVDAVKIDGAYVREALQTQRDAMLLKAMASLCRDLDVMTIAEMVEREDQLRHLQGLGVQKGQGWLFGKPVPLTALRRTCAA